MNVDELTEEKGNDYGHPWEDFLCVQEMATALKQHRRKEPAQPSDLGDLSCSPYDACVDHVLYMLLVKIARLAHSPRRRDTMHDIAGYAKTLEMCLDRDEENRTPLLKSDFVSAAKCKHDFKPGDPFTAKHTVTGMFTILTPQEWAFRSHLMQTELLSPDDALTAVVTHRDVTVKLKEWKATSKPETVAMSDGNKLHHLTPAQYAYYGYLVNTKGWAVTDAVRAASRAEGSKVASQWLSDWENEQ